MRVFIAIELNQEIRDCLARIYHPYLSQCSGIKWVPLENLHLTLKFLGEINPFQLSKVKRELTDICREHKGFSLHFGGLGVFPNLRCPKIIWAGVTDHPALIKLAQGISLLMETGDEKKFRPHITLGRVKDASPQTLVVIEELKEQKNQSFGTLRVDHVAVMESILRWEGPVYKKLSTIEFR